MDKAQVCPEYCKHLGEHGCTISVGDYQHWCPNDDPKLLEQMRALDDDWKGAGKRSSKTSPPPRPCRKIGCKNTTTNRNGYCVVHQDVAAAKEEERKLQWQKAEKDKRENSSKRGYNTSWKKLRECKLRSSPLCDVCGGVASVVHHRDHNAFNDTWDNLQCLCRNCHEELHGRKRKVG